MNRSRDSVPDARRSWLPAAIAAVEREISRLERKISRLAAAGANDNGVSPADGHTERPLLDEADTSTRSTGTGRAAAARRVRRRSH